VPLKPPIEAVEAPNVVQAWDVLKGNVQTGVNVVVVGGGQWVLETAKFWLPTDNLARSTVFPYSPRSRIAGGPARAHAKGSQKGHGHRNGR